MVNFFFSYLTDDTNGDLKVYTRRMLREEEFVFLV